ncbi:unnamed protein product [Brassica rapa]|uniref:Uncharacterized protein n=1 Tax=Brassica campestris TaxID=3711 RepID=A0A8D9LQ39_BRACM|nr:unnamed protein product [Brassica rapa]
MTVYDFLLHYRSVIVYMVADNGSLRLLHHIGDGLSRRLVRRSSLSTAEEKIHREGRTPRWMELVMTEDSSGELVDLEQS